MTHAEFVEAVRALLAEVDRPTQPAPDVLRVPSGGSLQAALATTAPIIELEAGGTYADLMVTRSVAIVGNGASLHGTGVPALHVPPGVSGVHISDLVCTSDWNGAVVQLGNNDASQTTLDQVPRDIKLERVIVPTHRGKRGFEINSADTQLVQCEARDVYTTTSQDSSALGILNTPGNIAILGGVYEGGSECVLVGGDVLKLVGVTAPAGLLFEGGVYTRPASWRTDGVKRIVKNIFELKTGHHVRVVNCVLERCWRDGQDGYAVMLTPTRGGSLFDVLFESCIIREVGGGVNITGLDSSGIGTIRTSGIVFRDCSMAIDKTTMGGTGWPFLLTGGPGTLEVYRTTISHDGNAVVYQSGPQVQRIVITKSTFNAGKYGLNLGGGANASLADTAVGLLNVSENTISGAAAALKSKLPANTYV